MDKKLKKMLKELRIDTEEWFKEMDKKTFWGLIMTTEHIIIKSGDEIVTHILTSEKGTIIIRKPD